MKVDLTDLVDQYPKYTQALGQKKNRNGRIIVEGALLPSENVTIEINDKTTDGAIKFLGNPVLWRIAKMKNQLDRCEQDLIPQRHF